MGTTPWKVYSGVVAIDFFLTRNAEPAQPYTTVYTVEGDVIADDGVFIFSFIHQVIWQQTRKEINTINREKNTQKTNSI